MNLNNHSTLAPQSPARSRGTFPAYPFPGFLGGGGLSAQPSNTGMSFRDFVAVKAMENILLHDDIDPESPSRIASLSYSLADAMIAARDA